MHDFLDWLGIHALGILLAAGIVYWYYVKPIADAIGRRRARLKRLHSKNTDP